MGNDGSKPDLKELSKSCKYSTKELNDWYKKFKKDFPSGKINRTEFVDLYRKMFGTDGDVKDFCEVVFKRYDSDGDGTISFQEFMTTLSVASRGTTQEKLRWAFGLYDIDGNGYLTEREINEILTAIYKSKGHPKPALKADETTREILSKADDDGDGRLSEAEFIKHSCNCEAIREMLQGF